MSIFEKIVYFLEAEMETPPSFGVWHAVSFLLMIGVAVFLAVKFKDADDKTLRRVLLVVWLTMIIFEVYKQVVFSMESDGVTATWKYQWYAFPFQFCSTPLYALPVLIFAREGKVRNAVMAYLASFSLFAGLAVMIYPNDVFIETIGINIQTMVHHGLQVAIGVLLVAHNRRHLNKRFCAWCMIVFSVFAAIALVLNVGVHHMLLELEIDGSFNMFYISPYYDCTLPVLSDIYQNVPYPVFLLIYLLGFALVSVLVYTIEKMIVKIIIKEKFIRDKNT